MPKLALRVRGRIMLRDNTDPEAELLRCRHEYRPSRFTNRDLHELVNRLSDLLTD